MLHCCKELVALMRLNALQNLGPLGFGEALKNILSNQRFVSLDHADGRAGGHIVGQHLAKFLELSNCQGLVQKRRHATELDVQQHAETHSGSLSL